MYRSTSVSLDLSPTSLRPTTTKEQAFSLVDPLGKVMARESLEGVRGEGEEAEMKGKELRVSQARNEVAIP